MEAIVVVNHLVVREPIANVDSIALLNHSCSLSSCPLKDMHSNQAGQLFQRLERVIEERRMLSRVWPATLNLTDIEGGNVAEVDSCGVRRLKQSTKDLDQVRGQYIAIAGDLVKVKIVQK